MKDLKMIHPIRRQPLSSLFLFVVLLLTACGDEVTYYTPEPEQPETPAYEAGIWVEDVKTLQQYGCYLQIPVLQPSWLLQAEGVKAFHKGNSGFAEQYITEDMLMVLRNPGPGTQISLKMDEGEIYNASEYLYTVSEEENGETLQLQVPVNWDYDALLQWKESRNVYLRWTVDFDGQTVHQYQKRFNCLSLYSHTVAIQYLKTDAADAEKIRLFKEAGLGDYPHVENGDTLMLYNNDFLAGYLNEHAPVMDELQQEMLDDGFITNMPFIPKWDLPAVMHTFLYPVIKHRIVTTTMQYEGGHSLMYPIDKVFADKQGDELGLSLAFASWCMRLNVPIRIQTGLVARIYVSISNENERYDIDAMSTVHAMNLAFPVSKPLQIPEDFEFIRGTAQDYMEHCTKSYQAEKVGESMANGYVGYCDFDPYKLREFLPSFGSGKGYARTRTAAPEKRVKAVTNPIWKEWLKSDAGIRTANR